MTEQRQSWQASSHKSRRVSSASIVVAVTIGLTVNLIFCDHTRAQSPLVDKPKLIPLVAAESYAEGSSVNLLCTLAQGAQGASLTFDWSKDGTRLAGAGNDNANNNYHIERNQDHSLLRIPHVKTSDAGEYKCTAKNQLGYDTTAVRLLINVKLSWIKEPKDTSVALNRELSVECQAKGEPKPRIRWEKLDNHQPYTFSSSINAPYNVNKTSQAQSRHSSSQLSSLVSDTRFLNFSHTSLSDSGIYECIASNGFDKDLRKVIQVQVHVPARFNERFTVVHAKNGSPARLECNATGDLPITIDWSLESASQNVSLDKRSTLNYEIVESLMGGVNGDPLTTNVGGTNQLISGGVSSALTLRSVSRQDASDVYRCTASNEHGTSEKLIKLVIIEVPDRPLNVVVKDVWSRSAAITWTAPPNLGNSPITQFVIQYWRKSVPNSLLGSTSQQQQQQSSSSSSSRRDPNGNSANTNTANNNHRRHEISVSGLQTSAIISNLSPALVYEASVIAENLVGRGEPSASVNISTGEEEPSAAPTDVSVEPRGPSTLKVGWKLPPLDACNGHLLGFYVGYRPRYSPVGLTSQAHTHTHSLDVGGQSLALSSSTPGSSHQQNNPANSQQVHGLSNVGVSGSVVSGVHNGQSSIVEQVPGVYSFKTIEFVSGRSSYDCFLTNLIRGIEYEIIVRAFNSAGSGPDSHVLHVRTYDGDLPPAPSLFVYETSSTSVQLRWTLAAGAHHQQAVNRVAGGQSPMLYQVRRFILYYQCHDSQDQSWLETGIPLEASSLISSPPSSSSSSIDRDQSSTSGGASRAQSLARSRSLPEPSAIGPLMITSSTSSASSSSTNGDNVHGAPVTSAYELNQLEPSRTYRMFVVGVNNFGMGDPSNVVTIKTLAPQDEQSLLASNFGSQRSSSLDGQSDDNNQLYQRPFDAFNRRNLSQLLVPLTCLTLAVLLVAGMAMIAVCIRRYVYVHKQHHQQQHHMRHHDSSSGITTSAWTPGPISNPNAQCTMQSTAPTTSPNTATNTASTAPINSTMATTRQFIDLDRCVGITSGYTLKPTSNINSTSTSFDVGPVSKSQHQKHYGTNLGPNLLSSTSSSSSTAKMMNSMLDSSASLRRPAPPALPPPRLATLSMHRPTQSRPQGGNYYRHPQQHQSQHPSQSSNATYHHDHHRIQQQHIYDTAS